MVTEVISGQLYLGDQTDATQTPLGEYGVDTVVTICQTENHLTDHQFPIDDGPHNYALFRDAVAQVVRSIKNGETVFVHCHAGQSRSVATAISVVAYFEGLSYDDAYHYVSSLRSVGVSRDLERSAKEFIRNNV